MPVPSSLTALMDRQSGVFSRQQVLQHGATEALLTRIRREGLWHQLGRGVWCVTAQPSWAGLAWAGVLLGGEGSVLGGAAAHHLWGLGPEPDVIDVWSPTTRGARAAHWRFRTGAKSGRGLPPRVSVEDAVLELCGAARREDDVVGLLSKAIGDRLTTVDRLRRSVLQTPNGRHRRLLIDVLAECEHGVESPLERRYLRDVERAHGLPRGVRQFSAVAGTRTDVAYEEYRLLVELDGRVYHDGLAASRDMHKDNEALLANYRTLRYGWPPVLRAPCLAANQVARGLAVGGWEGSITRCRRCP